LRAAKDVLLFCEDWQKASAEVWDTIRDGRDLAKATSEVLCPASGERFSALEVLSIITAARSKAASVRYQWFDTQPLWKACALASHWNGSNQSEDRAISLYALFQSINSRIGELQVAALTDLGFLAGMRTAGAKPSTVPAEAVVCSRAAVLEKIRQSGRGGAIKSLEAQGLLYFWPTDKPNKVWVLFRTPDAQNEFKAFLEKRGNSRKNVE
jgi:hypothetical protein